MRHVEEKLANIIVMQFAVDSDSITPATRFREDLEAGALGVAGLREAEGLLTVGDLLAYIKSKLIRWRPP